MIHLPDITPRELTENLASLGEPGYRAGQILQWVYRKGVCDYAEMTNLPGELQRKLSDRLAILSGKVIVRSDAPDGVVKLLIEWPDSRRVETVLIPTARRATACLSTQVGCGVGCRFCASGMGGLERNLTAGEIVEQLLQLQSAARRRVTNVVLMGTGEPLANYENTVAALRAIVDPRRMGLSARSVTVSTIGLPGQIRRLAKENMPITLAISLHAPNDALRRELIPAAEGASIAQIVAAAGEFYSARKREITLEYVLLKGVNDTKLCADGLARIAGRLRCNVNLIRYNPTASQTFEAPSTLAVRTFAERLGRRGINVHVRRSRGAGVDAACGQLRASYDKDVLP